LIFEGLRTNPQNNRIAQREVQEKAERVREHAKQAAVVMPGDGSNFYAQPRIARSQEFAAHPANGLPVGEGIWGRKE
jgi:hypothetical protein